MENKQKKPGPGYLYEDLIKMHDNMNTIDGVVFPVCEQFDCEELAVGQNDDGLQYCEDHLLD